MGKVKKRRLCVIPDRQSPTVSNFSMVPNKVCPSDSVNTLNVQHTDRPIRFLLWRNFSVVGRRVTFSVLLSPSTIEHDGDGEDDDDDGWNPETGNGHLPQTFLQKSKCQANMAAVIHSFIHASIHPFFLSFLFPLITYFYILGCFLYFAFTYLLRILQVPSTYYF